MNKLINRWTYWYNAGLCLSTDRFIRAISSSSSVNSLMVFRALVILRIITDRSFLRLRIFSCTSIGKSEPIYSIYSINSINKSIGLTTQHNEKYNKFVTYRTNTRERVHSIQTDKKNEKNKH